VTLAAEHRIAVKIQADLLLLDPALRWLYVIDRQAGKLAFYGLDAAQPPTLLGTYATAARVQHAAYLAGGHSIILAQADGLVSQWFPARNASGKPYLARVRDFDLPRDRQVTAIGPELRRRGFAVGDSVGQVSLFHATAGRLLERHQVADGPLQWLRFDARAQYLAVLDAHGQLSGFEVRNPHPEISLQALWGKVWYESYDEAQWLWHSSSTAADFEPKFSMTPLMFGTLKAAFYAMLFAIPIALLGAMFTAQFMAPDVRRVVKPTIEVLAALPSVVLGFIAGLWLAPFVETQLGGMFLLLLLLPLCIPAFGYLCLNLPASLRPRAGWEAVLLLPVIVLVVWLSFVLAPPLERLLFDGSLRDWLDRVLGIGYEQRNALVVGIAMGVAVIPSIFSIAEDAIFAVPRSLTVGSLALGATPWQTLIGVVLPTASPGIFSALMIGGGRAVGETMIVLMATGNTPLTDFSLFQGLRSFAANIAVELPESEVGSTHFRLLFLAGLVLFLFTFLLNTLAEVVRQRLRSRYSRI
jgi:phosphate transport system permease protein